MVFFVTGASTGIGNATARALAGRGQTVIAVARNTRLLESLKFDTGGRVQTITADLTDKSGFAAVVDYVNSQPALDGVVHAAGSLISPVAYASLNADEMLAHLNIHVTVPIALNTALQQKLAGGRIVYIDSYSASNVRIGWSGYSIVKAAAQMAARAAAEEMKQSAIIRIFPGAVRTPLVESVLLAQERSPTSDLFKEMAARGTISEPAAVGEFIAEVLLNATEQQLNEHDIWEMDSPDARLSDNVQ